MPKKGNIPWNKGIKTGRHNFPHIWGEKISKSKIGHKHSEETKKKISETQRRNPNRGFKGKHHTIESNEKNRVAHLGKQAWNKGKGYKTGLNKKIRQLQRFAQWRSNVFQRDSWTCQTCGNRGGELHPHHIIALNILIAENKIRTIEDAENCMMLWDEKNGITLCANCHKLTDNYGKNFKMKV